MSKLVCHVEKYTKSAVTGIQKHNQRESMNSKNKDIDREKTHLNYDLRNGKSTNYTQQYKSIMDNGYKSNRPPRKDAIAMCEVLVTSDSEFFKDMPMEKQKEFFQTAYNQVAEMYGEKNIIAGKVHMDEKTPHMHLDFVPLTDDGRLCAKELTSRAKLKQLQTRLPKALKEAGFVIERGLEATGVKHKDTNVWKQEQASMALQLEAREKELQAKQVELGKRENEVKTKEQDLDQREQRVATSGELLQIRNRIQLKERGFLNKERYCEVLPEDMDKIWDTASTAARMAEENKSVGELKAQSTTLQNQNLLLRDRNSSLERENKFLNVSVKAMGKELNTVASGEYKRLSNKMGDDKTVAVATTAKGFTRETTANTIGARSSSAPPVSNKARSYGQSIVAAALNNPAVATLTAKFPDEDWSCLSAEAKMEKAKEMDLGIE